jgi:hypothetical protein
MRLTSRISTMSKTEKRMRRTPEKMIEDLQAEIERIKTRAVQAKVKKDPALRHINGAVRSIDKAARATSDSATRKALEGVRATLTACLKLAGVADKGVLSPQRREQVDPKAVVDYLAKHPGSSGEDVARALATDTKSLRPTIKKLVEAGDVKANGRARGTRYSAVK